MNRLVFCSTFLSTSHYFQELNIKCALLWSSKVMLPVLQDAGCRCASTWPKFRFLAVLVSTVCVQAVNINDVCKHPHGTAAARELDCAGEVAHISSFCSESSILERRMFTQPLALERCRVESGPASAEDGGCY